MFRWIISSLVIVTINRIQFNFLRFYLIFLNKEFFFVYNRSYVIIVHIPIVPHPSCCPHIINEFILPRNMCRQLQPTIEFQYQTVIHTVKTLISFDFSKWDVKCLQVSFFILDHKLIQ